MRDGQAVRVSAVNHTKREPNHTRRSVGSPLGVLNRPVAMAKRAKKSAKKGTSPRPITNFFGNPGAASGWVCEKWCDMHATRARARTHTDVRTVTHAPRARARSYTRARTTRTHLHTLTHIRLPTLTQHVCSNQVHLALRNLFGASTGVLKHRPQFTDPRVDGWQWQWR